MAAATPPEAAATLDTNTGVPSSNPPRFVSSLCGAILRHHASWELWLPILAVTGMLAGGAAALRVNADTVASGCTPFTRGNALPSEQMAWLRNRYPSLKERADRLEDVLYIPLHLSSWPRSVFMGALGALLAFVMLSVRSRTRWGRSPLALALLSFVCFAILVGVHYALQQWVAHKQLKPHAREAVALWHTLQNDLYLHTVIDANEWSRAAAAATTPPQL